MSEAINIEPPPAGDHRRDRQRQARPRPWTRGTRSWTLWRRLLLTAAFLLLIVNPLVNYYLGITFVQG